MVGVSARQGRSQQAQGAESAGRGQWAGAGLVLTVADPGGSPTGLWEGLERDRRQVEPRGSPSWPGSNR